MVQIIIYGLVMLVILATLLRMTPIWDKILTAKPAQIIDFATLKAPNKPNWFLLCEENFCEGSKTNMVPPLFDQPADELKGRLETLLLEVPNAEVRLDDGNQMDVLVRTPIMRWPDIISVQVVPLENDKSTIRIYSRSIYGRSDLGANKTRVIHWLKRLQA